MTDDNTTTAVNMSQRAVMQYLSLTEWKAVSQLPVPAGQAMLDRIHGLGWIERRGNHELKSGLLHRDLKRCGPVFDTIRGLGG
jgi:hypothetical protein